MNKDRSSFFLKLCSYTFFSLFLASAKTSAFTLSACPSIIRSGLVSLIYFLAVLRAFNISLYLEITSMIPTTAIFSVS